MQNNTIFITGGSSGIGRGLAEAFHARGNHVIITGRREDRLREVCERNPGMHYFVLDVTDAEGVRAAARDAISQFPALNCVINNAGVQLRIDFGADGTLDDEALRAEVETNVLGPIRVTSAFLPHLKTQKDAVLVNVSSGLAFVPMARFPVYCATKAAVHSWTVSLRHQLRHWGIRVIELIPPYVATELGGPGKPVATAEGRGPMPLDEFIHEAMKELSTGEHEVAVHESKRLLAATSPETVRRVFDVMNER